MVRIWFNDHPPPHFHVLLRRDSSDSLARFAIETLDLLSGYVVPATRRKVQEWARGRREELMTNWGALCESPTPVSYGTLIVGSRTNNDTAKSIRWDGVDTISR